LGGVRGNNGVGLGGIVPGIALCDDDAVSMNLMNTENLVLAEKKGVFQQAAVILSDCLEGVALVESGGVAEVEGIKGWGADAADAGAKGVWDSGGLECQGMVPDGIGGFSSE